MVSGPGSSRFVVIGAGLAGAATAWQLARRGHEVTVLERSTPANPRGSSHGSARIFRYAYPDRFYAGLVVAAATDWTELERLSGCSLLSTTGALDFGATRDPRALAGVLEQVGVEHELLTADQAGARWPQMNFETAVLHHPGAGVLDAAGAVQAMLGLARADGAQVLCDWPVASVARTGAGAGFRVLAEDGRSVQAERVVVCVGGWLADLLGRLDLPPSFLAGFPPLEVWQENTFHFPYRDGFPDAWPTFVHKTARLQTYGLPGGRDANFAGQKVAQFRGGTTIAGAAAQTGAVDPGNRERIVDYVRRSLPGLAPEPYAATTCLFTCTATEDFVLDGVDGVTVASPCSGHGAKFAPLLGRLTADVAEGGTAPSRFQVGRRAVPVVH